MDPFVEQLKHLCAQHPTRSKWVFVPSHALGRTLGDRIVLEGTNWANLRFVTPLDIALRMGAPFLVERGIDPSEEELGPALMMRLLQKLEKQQRRQRQDIFKAEDEVMEKRDSLIESLERRLSQHTAADVLFTIRWAVT